MPAAREPFLAAARSATRKHSASEAARRDRRRSARRSARGPANGRSREQHRCSPQVASAARLFHTSRRHGICRSRHRWPPRNLAAAQQALSRLAAAAVLRTTWDAPTPAAMSAALNVLEAQAQFDGPERKVSVRIAEHDGLIYLDLADEFWRCYRNRPRWLADRRRGPGPVPPPGRHAGAATSGARRVDRQNCAGS